MKKEIPNLATGVDCGKSIEVGSNMLWITSWPHGRVKLVRVLGANDNIAGGIYIAKAEGGTDTTTEEFLFEIPLDLKASKRNVFMAFAGATVAGKVIDNTNKGEKNEKTK